MPSVRGYIYNLRNISTGFWLGIEVGFLWKFTSRALAIGATMSAFTNFGLAPTMHWGPMFNADNMLADRS